MEFARSEKCATLQCSAYLCDQKLRAQRCSALQSSPSQPARLPLSAIARAFVRSAPADHATLASRCCERVQLSLLSASLCRHQCSRSTAEPSQCHSQIAEFFTLCNNQRSLESAASAYALLRVYLRLHRSLSRSTPPAYYPSRRSPSSISIASVLRIQSNSPAQLSSALYRRICSACSSSLHHLHYFSCAASTHSITPICAKFVRYAHPHLRNPHTATQPRRSAQASCAMRYHRSSSTLALQPPPTSGAARTNRIARRARCSPRASPTAPLIILPYSLLCAGTHDPVQTRGTAQHCVWDTSHQQQAIAVP